MTRLRSIVVAFALAIALVLPAAASASSAPSAFTYLAGTSFLCGFDPSACPDWMPHRSLTSHRAPSDHGGFAEARAPDDTTIRVTPKGLARDRP